ncbi:MAG: hypothetical protein II800_00165 [Lachnospiraceae bacterium]|nr:hypothetical protein [Lachnospiraceae bacterium]
MMKNTQITTFERNRYYAGKALTTADFQAEQAYFNNKRHFLNSMMYGAGVVCGLGVVSLDDLSILVESGVAIDGMGREIVVDNSVVKKLSAIDGYDGLKTAEVSLCIRYHEEAVHTVYAVSQNDPDREYEYNRIREGFQIFLTDTSAIPPLMDTETEFLARGVLLNSDDYRVELRMPATVSRGRLVCMTLHITKLTENDTSLTYHGVLQIPAFLAPDGSQEMELSVSDVRLGAGESLDYSYWMTTQEIEAEETNILLKSGSVGAFLNDRIVTSAKNFSMKIKLSDETPREIIGRELGRPSLEMRGIGVQGEFIELARMTLLRTDSASIINTIRETGVKRYVTAPSQDRIREEYLQYFIRENASLAADGGGSGFTGQAMRPGNQFETPLIETGIVEIPLKDHTRKGDICYSGEIMHGLGKGNVYVSVAYEYIREDASLGEISARNTIYGNPALFAKEQDGVIDAETAVRVLNDKGSFVVAVKLLQNVEFLVLTYRWVAIKFPTGSVMTTEDDFEGKSIAAQTPTVVMGTKDSYYFGIRYNNMEPCSVTYELVETGSGEITSDGVYTAPAREGVYEIRIYCTDMPMICTYAYAIVKKKGLEQGEGDARPAGPVSDLANPQLPGGGIRI